MTSSQHRLLLLAILAAVLAIRLAVFMTVYPQRPNSILTPDSQTYEWPAHCLLSMGRFSQSVNHPGPPDTVRTPGYPVFIAAIEAAGGGRAAVIAVQILLSLGTIALVYAGARRLWRSRPAALIATALIGLDPASFHYSEMLLSETLFTLALMAVLYCGCRTAREGTRRPLWAVLMGLALAVSALIRPVTYYAMAPVAFWLLVVFRRRRASWRGALAWTLAAAVPWLALAGGWQARNLLAIGDARFCQIENVNLYMYRAADVLARHEGISLGQMQERLAQQADRDLAGAPERVRFAYYRRQGLAVLRSHPGLALRSWGRGLGRLLFRPATLRLYAWLSHSSVQTDLSADAQQLSPLSLARKWIPGRPLLLGLALAEACLMLTGYAGLAAGPWLARRRWRARWPEHALWLGALAYLAAVSAGPEAYARMRVPLMPILAVYGGYFVWRLVRGRRGSR